MHTPHPFSPQALCVLTPLREVRVVAFVASLLLAFANPALAQQLAILQKMPAGLLRYTGGAKPDADGMVSYNRGGFKSPEFQRGAMLYLIRGVVASDREAAADAWRAIDATFQRQTDAGNFGRAGQPHGGPSAVAFWLADLDQAILVLRESGLGPEYKDRLAQLLPKVRRAAQWLAQPRYQERLKREDADAPNRLLFDGLAYGLSGILADDNELKQLGRRFVDLAMTQFRATDGVFLEKGGHDSSYQAVAALNLQVWLLYFPDKRLADAAAAAVRWERARIKPDGQVDVTGNSRTGLRQEQWMGHPKGVNLSQITLCLLYDYARTGNQQSLDAARRIVSRRTRS
ncbi:MAG: hypothetical protein LLG00_07365 [Planctomycetaceae bacterium]|nr:hypothetical protein [Planctomycetaceae bacterium]